MIADRNIAKAIEDIATEFMNLEGMNDQLNRENRQLQDENDDLRDKVEELEAKIKKLEEELVELHLTGKADGKESQ